MSEHLLSPSEIGAEILARAARERLSGLVSWTVDEKTYRLMFRAGRPEAVVAADGARIVEREKVVHALRALAVATLGRVRVSSEDVPAGDSLAIDTLGESMLALVHALRPDQVEDILAARGDRVVRASAQFERLSRAVVSLRAPELTTPSAPAPISELAQGQGPAGQRAFIAVLVLGGFEDAHAVAPAAAPSAPAAPAAPATGPQPALAKEPAAKPAFQYPALPSDKRALELALEIKGAHRAALKQTFYEVLGVDVKATSDDIRKAYFEAAKRWHSDRFAGIPLGDWAKYADELFHHVDEAQKTLCDPQKRGEYDYVLDRKAKGLPTDVSVILEAEAMFKKAQGMVKRGEATLAEPLLKQATELNKGEPDFWIYYGYAMYAARGKEAVLEARAKIKQGLDAKPNSDVAYEFLGKIARAEGEYDVAKRQLDKALELNPKNTEAEREMRFVQMRAQRAKQGPAAGGLLSKLFKK